MGNLATFPDIDELKAEGWQEAGFLKEGPYTLETISELQGKKWGGWSFTNAGDIYADSVSGVKASDSYHNAPRVPKPHECCHCYRQTHPGPLTERQARMYDSFHFDASYDPAADDSPVVCIGADYEGPMPATATHRYNSSAVTWVTDDSSYDSYSTYQSLYAEHVKAYAKKIDSEWGKFLPKWAEPLVAKMWIGGPYYIAGGSPYLPVVEKKCTEDDKLPIKFNDWDNWKPWEKPEPWYPIAPALDIKWEQWHSSFPKPESPGYDFTAFNKPETYPKGKK